MDTFADPCCRAPKHMIKKRKKNKKKKIYIYVKICITMEMKKKYLGNLI